MYVYFDLGLFFSHVEKGCNVIANKCSKIKMISILTIFFVQFLGYQRVTDMKIKMPSYILLPLKACLHMPMRSI
jgi:hypothetical protein